MSFHKHNIHLALTSHLGERIILLGLLVGIPLMLFHNIDINPRPWHDEGIYLTLARTLAEDGVYAVHNSDGYQTFGAVQSVGPTVIVPVALVYRYFGVNILNGRIVVAIYTLIALLLFFLVGQRLFDCWTAIVGLIFLLTAPAVRILIYGREVLGEVPGFAFFLAGYLMYVKALSMHKPVWILLAGIFFGAAIVTKNQYLIIIPGTMGVMAILDVVFFRQGLWKKIVLITILAICCGVAWQVWQLNYYGIELYMDNLSKMRELASITNGFNNKIAISGIRALMGNDSGHFYLFWGFPALGYMVILSTKRNLQYFIKATLVVFTLLWLGYFMFWSIPWHHYGLPAMALVALFVAKLYIDIARNFQPYLLPAIRKHAPNSFTGINSILILGSVVGIFSYTMWAGYNLQQYIRSDVMDRIGNSAADLRSPPQLQNPRDVAAYLQNNISSSEIIETWERELGILTNLTYHYPDQSMLIYTHNTLYRGGETNYLLGEDYLNKSKADYVVIGWFARSFPIYDMNYIQQNSKLVKSVGTGNYSYDIYQLLH